MKHAKQFATVLMACALFACGGGDSKDKDKIQENTPELCSDNKDNDGNGKADCDDPGCAPFAFCQATEEGKENTLAACQDGKDNDGDGMKDCEDPDCATFAICGGTSSNVSVEDLENTVQKCTDGQDNDQNGKPDCEDVNCQSFAVCAPLIGLVENTKELCSDGKDNDFSGKKDCEDPSCALFCVSGGNVGENTPELCQDGQDNDGDGKADCNDPECQIFDFCSSDYIEQQKICDKDKDAKGCENGKVKDQCPNDPFKLQPNSDGCDCNKTSINGTCYTNIVSGDQFKQLSSADYRESKFIVKMPIDLGTWTNAPIGSFKGTLDGGNQRITGVINQKATSNACGLFGALTGATFQNIDMAITLNCQNSDTFDKNLNAGALVASLGNGTAKDIRGSSKVYVEELPASKTPVTNLSASLTHNIGGLIGDASSTILENIDVRGNVSFFNNAPGATGSSDSIVYNLNVGGIVGKGTNGKKLNANNFVTVQRPGGIPFKQSQAKIGGLAGELNGTLENSHNKGVVRVETTGADPIQTSRFTYVGGLVGESKTIQTSTFSGTIDIVGSSPDADAFAPFAHGIDDKDQVMNRGLHVGGIAGALVKESHINGCHTDAAISLPAKGSVAGGIVSMLQGDDMMVLNSSSNVDLTLVNKGTGTGIYWGGIVGYAYYDSAAIDQAAYIINNSARTNYVEKEDLMGATVSLNGISGFNGIVVNNFASDTKACKNDTECYYYPGAIGGAYVYESYWNVDEMGSVSGASDYTDGSSEAYHFDLLGIPVTYDQRPILGLLRYNAGHNGGVLSANIPKDKSYVDWTVVVDGNGKTIPVPVR